MENSNLNMKESPFKSQPLSALSIEFLGDASPWMKFISILGFIFSGLMVIIAFASLAMPSVNSIGFLSFIIYLIAGIVMILPNIYLFNYAKKINQYIESDDTDKIETAFEMQKKYWQYVGICAIIYLAIISIVVLAGILGILTR